MTVMDYNPLNKKQWFHTNKNKQMCDLKVSWRMGFLHSFILSHKILLTEGENNFEKLARHHLNQGIKMNISYGTKQNHMPPDKINFF